MSRLPDLWSLVSVIGDEQACRRRLARIRWGEDGFVCPRCTEARRWSYISTRDLYQCNVCSYQASITSGTVLQDTKLDLRDWFLAAYLDQAFGGRLSTQVLSQLLGIHGSTAQAVLERLRGREGEQGAADLLAPVVSA